jgi:hypothetical protein
MVYNLVDLLIALLTICNNIIFLTNLKFQAYILAITFEWQVPSYGTGYFLLQNLAQKVDNILNLIEKMHN